MATIIKSAADSRASGQATRGVAFSLADMTAQADDYVSEVRVETHKLIAEAQAAADAIRAEAEANGRRAAEQAAMKVLDQKVGQRMQTLIPALQTAAQELADARHDWQRWWEAQAIGLARAMAERIVRRELAADPAISLAWVREALELAAGAGEITVQLAPGDLDTIRGQVEQLATIFAPTATMRIVADETVAPGGCRVVTEFGVVDERLQTQLDRLVEELGGGSQPNS
ncbi:MAG: hypothetical protein KF688_01520 [Pirellulales bacterium]|nr:hypothetical protein [Pirellulales bacterium]MBX3434195.1 hypothetical protein [Pirellulales bacterium]